MISVNKKTIKSINKIGIYIVLLYSLGFLVYKGMIYIQSLNEKEQLTSSLEKQKKETNLIKEKIILSDNKIKALEANYITTEELETKIKDIYTRMSVFDYNLKYLNIKKMCIDRHIIVSQLTSESENGLKAGYGVLTYIGNVQRSEKNDSIFFVDYIASPKGKM